MPRLRWFAALAAPCWLSLVAAPSPAANLNPDISLIGQPSLGWSDGADDPGRKRPRFDPGETEILFDAALNPYARGTATLSFEPEAAGVEEAYFSMTRGLPAGLALKGGKYRLGFGRLNIAHPHTDPFGARPRVLGAFLPGEGSLNETALQVSGRIPAPGDVAITLSADWLAGDSFRRPRASSGASNDPLEVSADGDREGEPRPGVLGRVSTFFPLGDRSGIEVGGSALHGTGNVAAAARTTVFGTDVKAKFWNSARSYLVVQGEWLALNREEAGWDSVAARYVTARTRPAGGYVFADYNFDLRYNVGASFERHRDPGPAGATSHTIGAFAGLALLEESTVFRAGWERHQPDGISGGPRPRAVQSVTLRVIFSMGPHRAHQF